MLRGCQESSPSNGRPHSASCAAYLLAVVTLWTFPHVHGDVTGAMVVYIVHTAAQEHELHAIKGPVEPWAPAHTCHRFHGTGVLEAVWVKNIAERVRCMSAYLSRLLWIFPRAPLKINGAPGNIQGNLRGICVSSLENLPWWQCTATFHHHSS